MVCGAEFGRTPVLETGGGGAGARVTNGRDHNPFGSSIRLAGAGLTYNYSGRDFRPTDGAANVVDGIIAWADSNRLPDPEPQ